MAWRFSLPLAGRIYWHLTRERYFDLTGFSLMILRHENASEANTKNLCKPETLVSFRPETFLSGCRISFTFYFHQKPIFRFWFRL